MTTGRALLLDLGNVLARFDHGITVRTIAQAAGISPAAVAPQLFGDLVDALDRGRLDATAFFRGVERRAGIGPLPEETWVRAWRDIFEPIPEALALLGRLRPDVRTALVSNTNALHWDGVLRVCDVDRRVDFLALSFEIGALKPEPAIFEAALRGLGSPAGAATFADDRPELVAGARALGLDAFLVDRADSLERGLRERGLLID